MRVLRKIIATLLVILLIPLLWAALGLQAARDTVLSPTFLKEVLVRRGAYGALPGTVAAQLERNLAGLPVPVPPEDVERLLARVLPAPRLQAMVEPLVDGMYAWLRGEVERPTLVLELRVVLSDLVPAVRDYARLRLQSMGACSAAQLAQWDQAVQRYGRGEAVGPIPECKPPDADEFLPELDRMIQDPALLQGVPERLDLAAEVEKGNPGFWSRGARERAMVQLVLAAATWAWVLVAVMAGLLALLNLDRWYTPLGWLGVPLVVAGLGLAGASRAALGVALPEIAGGLAGVPGGALLQGLVSGAAEMAALLILRYGLYTAGAGAVCIVGLVAAAVMAPRDPPVQQGAA